VRKYVWIVIALLTIGSSYAFAADDESEFKDLITKYYTAWNTMNSANAAQFYAQDPDLVYYDIAPLQYHGFKEYQDGAQKNFFDTATTCKLTPNNDLKVTRHGDIAWTTLTFHLSAVFKQGGALELDARQTSIWEKRDGKWLIVHEHISTPLKQ